VESDYNTTNLAQTAVQILLITETYKAQNYLFQTQTVAAVISLATVTPTVQQDTPTLSNVELFQTQTIEALLTQASPAQTQAAAQLNTQVPSDTALPASTIPPVAGGFFCVPTNTQRNLAQVVQVIDGDTIDVNVKGTTQRVRYIGMDTPRLVMHSMRNQKWQMLKWFQGKR
jgi:hypothetical protein